MENKRWVRSVPTIELKKWKLEGNDAYVVQKELGRRKRKSDRRLKRAIDRI